MTPPTYLTAALAAAARDLGFAALAVSPVEPLAQAEGRLADWLGAGHHGQMAYMAEQGPRGAPRALLDAARSLVVVAWPHDVRESPAASTASAPSSIAPGASAHAAASHLPPPAHDATPPAAPPLTGRIARYARGRDYHNVMRDKLYQLADAATALVGRPVLARVCVDTAPLLEKPAAERAGLGFIAKNTLLIMPGVGSYALLGELLLDIELTPGTPQTARCGDCRACLDVCPTKAFPDAFVLDARRCISYLTIEHRGVVPRELRPLIGTWVFGCDLCQEVCPFNAAAERRPPPDNETKPRGDLAAPDLARLLWLGAADYRRLVRRTALRRVDAPQLQRNAAIALGNCKDERAIPLLIDAVARHPNANVRLHAVFSLGAYADSPAARAVVATARGDADPDVAAEAEWVSGARALPSPPLE